MIRTSTSMIGAATAMGLVRALPHEYMRGDPVWSTRVDGLRLVALLAALYTLALFVCIVVAFVSGLRLLTRRRSEVAIRAQAGRHLRWSGAALVAALALETIDAIPQDLSDFLVVVMLNGVIIVYAAAMLLLPTIGVRWAFSRGIRARRILLCSAAGLACGLLLEGGAGYLESREVRPRASARRHDDRVRDDLIDAALEGIATEMRTAGGGATLRVLVLGDSQAAGVPYSAYAPFSGLIGGKLQRAFPGRRVVVDSRAMGGLTLSAIVADLAGFGVRPPLRDRPDAVVLLAGNYEFLSRFDRAREVDYYVDDDLQRPRKSVVQSLRGATPLCRQISRVIDRHTPPTPPKITERSLVDRPVCTPSERAKIVRDVGERTDALLGFCDRVGAVPILILPPGNDRDCPPCRSVLDPIAPASSRDAFARAFLSAREQESANPSHAMSSYRNLVSADPSFAAAHFRLGDLLVLAGRSDEADACFRRARDLDGMPIRCPGDVSRAMSDAGARHNAIVIDGRTCVQGERKASLGDDTMHDAVHPSLKGYLSLADASVDGILSRLAPDHGNSRRIAKGSAADAPMLDAASWANVYRISAYYRDLVAGASYQPEGHRAIAEGYLRAADKLTAGIRLKDAGIPGPSR